MVKKISKLSYLAAVALFVAALLTPAFTSMPDVSAQQQGNQGSSNTNSNSDQTNGKRLQGNDLEKCQHREKAINSVMARIGDRAQKQIGVIGDIADRVQKFYQDKDLTVENYDQLMAKVQERKASATTAMNQVRNMNGQFSCGNDDPKGVAAQFKSYAATQSDDVTAYKNAVHDLVVAIKTAVGEN